MSPDRFEAVTQAYDRLRVAVAGDFCLDRYLEIDPGRAEVSIETGLPVHNITGVRAQPGGAGTILNNLAALGIGALYPVGFHGEDGEGYELRRALGLVPRVRMDYFVATADRRTFTYCKPLVIEPGRPPRELNRLDQKNWTPTPGALSARLGRALSEAAGAADAVALLSQVDLPESGVLTRPVLDVVGELMRARPGRLMVADSRLGLRGFPPVIFKMNAVELSALTGMGGGASLATLAETGAALARRHGQPVFITLAERGLVGALPDGTTHHVPAFPLRGEIDVVGAGDAVTANLTAALAAGATVLEALELASAAASIVIHQLGTTGTASIPQIRERIFGSPAKPL